MILSFDLGTGGAKVCIYGEAGRLHSKTFKAYPTKYPVEGFHVQDPIDWWNAVVDGTRDLISREPSLGGRIASIAISGQSLTVIPLDAEGDVIFNDIPIWSDTRAGAQCGRFFSKVDKLEWYMNTGNGFTPECYSLFKIMWYKDNYPEEFKKAEIVLGSKDYINYRLTGEYKTDYSYASGSGGYSLEKRAYVDEYFDAAGVSKQLLPEPEPSEGLVGKIRPEAASEMMISRDAVIYCGGVDNSCMALGAKNTTEGNAYLSLGSSAWIAVSSSRPLTDPEIKPFIFDHIVPGLYTSATSIFSAGSSLKWFRENFAGGLEEKARSGGRDIYDLITEAASASGPGAKGVIFNPTLAGTPEASSFPDITGAFLNLRLNTGFDDIARAVLEGITYELYGMYSKLESLCNLAPEIVIVGGGSKSRFWRQMFADVFNRNFSLISTDQDAAALGAAAAAAVGSGVWDDYTMIDEVIEQVDTVVPDRENTLVYPELFEKYKSTWKLLSEAGRLLKV
jgi:xylulokinase